MGYDQVFKEFLAALKQQETPDLRAHWSRYQGTAHEGHQLLLEMLEQEIFHCLRANLPVQIEDYVSRFPELNTDEVRELQAAEHKYRWRRLEAVLAQKESPAADSSASGRLRGSHPYLPGFADWKFLGSGNMGKVWRATRVALQRQEAIKIPHAHVLEAVGREFLLREARAVAQFHHDHICPIYEVGDCDAGPYICMKYVEGKTLKAWADAEPPPTTRALAEKVALVAQAVAFMHTQAIVHRDLKSTNIMIEDGAESRPVVVDFGLAKRLTPGGAQQSQYDLLKGTPAFMAPEQVPGQGRPVTPLTDVYALGALLYDLHVGRPPFVGTTEEVLHQILHTQPSFPRELSARTHGDFQSICLKALAKDPGERYRSAQEMAEELRRFERGEVILARPVGLLGRLQKWVRKNPRRLAVGITGLLLVAVLGLWLSWVQQKVAVAEIERQIPAFTEAELSNPVNKNRVETLLAQMEERDASRAATKLQEYIHALLRQPRLGPEDVNHIHRLLEHLGALNPGLARESERRLAGRRAEWQTLFELQAPFAQRAALFGLQDLRVADNVLLQQVPAADRNAVRVVTSLASQANCELVATFAAPSWTLAQKVGLILNATPSSVGYQFVLRGPN
ncbi:MAG: serine/threonine protein kinase, partial [Gemmataceae bacterium]|nr:serine/threonine protein kinase [Gemmataceae bacterium]